MRKLLVLNIFLFVLLYCNAQNIVLTDVLSNKDGYLLVYENKNYKEVLGKLIFLKDSISYDNIQFEQVIERGGIIYKPLDDKNFKYIHWNLQNPFSQSENHILLNVPDSISSNNNREDEEYFGLKFNPDIKLGELLGEFILDDTKVCIYKMCINGIKVDVKYSGNDLFIDGKLDTKYIVKKTTASIFIPFSDCY